MSFESLLTQIYGWLNALPGYYNLASNDIASAINKIQIADGSAGTPLLVKVVSNTFTVEKV